MSRQDTFSFQLMSFQVSGGGALTPCFVLTGGLLYTVVVQGRGFCPLRGLSQAHGFDETSSRIKKHKFCVEEFEGLWERKTRLL